MRHLLAAIFAGLVLLGLGREASASQYHVSPITLTFPVGTTSSLLTLTNQNPKEPTRVQVTAFAWDQGAGGEMKLSPTSDIVFFPSMITLAPKEARKLRIGLTATAQNVEKTYRIFIEELAPPPVVGKAEAVRVLTRMGVPIFVEGAQVTRTPRIEALRVANKRIGFDVKNAGSAHFLLRKVRITGKDAAGQAVFTKEEAGWYVLAAGTRSYELDLPKEVCGAKELAVELETDLTPPVRATLPNPPCTP